MSNVRIKKRTTIVLDPALMDKLWFDVRCRKAKDFSDRVQMLIRLGLRTEQELAKGTREPRD